MAAVQSKAKSEPLKEYLGLMGQFRPLDGAQESACLALARAGDGPARRRLVESYLPRVVSWVAPSRGRGLSFAGLIQVGNTALVAALDAPEKTPNLEETLRRRVAWAVENAVITRA